MSEHNGIIRIGRKGIKKFAFGDGPAFEVDVVAVFQEFLRIDDVFRPAEEDEGGFRRMPLDQVSHFHGRLLEFVQQLSNQTVSTGEALDFFARVREEYDALADFFLPKRRKKDESSATSEEGSLRFSAEPDPSATSTNSS
jgi:hypothetical protein